MVVYNELVAVTAGAGLLGFGWFLTQLLRGRRIEGRTRSLEGCPVLASR